MATPLGIKLADRKFARQIVTHDTRDGTCIHCFASVHQIALTGNWCIARDMSQNEFERYARLEVDTWFGGVYGIRDVESFIENGNLCVFIQQGDNSTGFRMPVKHLPGMTIDSLVKKTANIVRGWRGLQPTSADYD